MMPMHPAHRFPTVSSWPRRVALALFTALKPLKIQWFGLTTTILGHDDELLDACATSGCRGLLMGLESISPSSLRGMRKSFNDPETFARLVERLHQRSRLVSP